VKLSHHRQPGITIERQIPAIDPDLPPVRRSVVRGLKTAGRWKGHRLARVHDEQRAPSLRGGGLWVFRTGPGRVAALREGILMPGG
jgi:hypothetical protein